MKMSNWYMRVVFRNFNAVYGKVQMTEARRFEILKSLVKELKEGASK